MIANFEEKTYENYFNCELDKKSQIFFPPGQVQEGVLGFDSIAFSTNRKLWRTLGHPYWFFQSFEGVEFREIAALMEIYLRRKINNIPPMRANILFQYKKPEFISSSKGNEWSHWNEPYYRYDIYQQQQSLLMNIHNGFSSKVLIVYASPAIHDVNELVSAKLKGEIIKRSNFKKVEDLVGHDRNTYTESGLHSIACSEPERLENIDILQILEALDNNLSKEENNRIFIIKFREQLISLVIENQYPSKGLKALLKPLAEFEKYPLVYSFMVMNIFRQLTSLQWLIKI